MPRVTQPAEMIGYDLGILDQNSGLDHCTDTIREAKHAEYLTLSTEESFSAVPGGSVWPNKAKVKAKEVLNFNLFVAQ